MKEQALWDIAPGFDFLEDMDMSDKASWFFDGTHSLPLMSPLYLWYWSRCCRNGLRQLNEKLSIPTVRGHEIRVKHGSFYNTIDIVTDKEEIAAREVKFKKAMVPWIEDFDGLWENGKNELLNMYEKIKEIDPSNASNNDLYHLHYDLLFAYIRMWEIHMDSMYASYFGWTLLEDLLKERFGISDSDPQFHNMMCGFDNKVFQVDRRLWELGQHAIELGLSDMFIKNEGDKIISNIENTNNGKSWMAEFKTFLDEEGWRMVTMNDFVDPYWLEDPSIPIEIVKTFISHSKSFNLDNTRRDLEKKREAAVKALLDKVPIEERDLYRGLIGLAQKCASFSEEHDLYCELYIHGLMRRAYVEMGKRLAKSGTIDRPEDIFMLNFDEIERCIVMPDPMDLRFIVNRRYAAREEYKRMEIPPVITKRSSMDEAVMLDMVPSRDPIIMKIVMGDLPVPKPELKADLFGTCGSAGVAEGIARVVLGYQELKQVKPGEIVVCHGTNPAWTQIFGLIKGLISDRGGALSHAAIVGREFAVPVIVNTFKGTSVIKTGQRIKMDASQGAVYILDKD